MSSLQLEILDTDLTENGSKFHISTIQLKVFVLA